MKNLTAREIREAFLAYFESKGHRRVPSSPLVPYNDQTLLFVNAGMVQFKDVFLGLDKRDYSRAVTAQRCVRAGGKHNDLDTVGRTARHHTFFEMMGNFSFGDYFKRDAILFAWEFLTEVLEMPKDRLYVTVYEEDDEAYELWHQLTGIDYGRIYRIGAKDNFWAMGDTGPCGPCSEIFFDRGEHFGCDAEECGIGKCDCDRWMEIWNLVFMQFDRSEDGALTPLPHPSIDTGMGLERVASILQNVESNYDTDIMRGIIDGVAELSGKPYYEDQRGFPFRVIADHARSCSFMIADGIIPSNEGRGYVLRRILRRAARFGMVIGLSEPFLYKIFPYVKASLCDHYPEIVAAEDSIVRAIRQEEERFHLTLKAGMSIAEGMIEKTRAAGGKVLAGKDLFMLYDTYGFPLDLAKDIAEENGFSVDEAGFDAAMAEQREKSHAQKGGGNDEEDLLAIGQLLSEMPVGEFAGYQQDALIAHISALVVNDALCDTVSEGASGWLTLDRTPFYGESGGQIGDSGAINTDSALLFVSDSKKLANGLIIHRFHVEEGSVKVGESVEAVIDGQRRLAIARNHSATHLLHRALRMVLGQHVHQSGSLVTDERLRFDFNHSQPLTAEELLAIEDETNKQIIANHLIDAQQMPIDEAKALGAMAFFGDKYGDIVRLVSMGQVSRELCGGTHCHATGDIGSLRIVSEAGIGAGLRRIEAVTGFNALNLYREQQQLLLRLSDKMKTTPANCEKRLDNIIAEGKAQAREIEKLQAKLNKGNIDELWRQAEDIGGVKLLTAQVAAADMAALRNSVDMLRDKLPDAVIVLAAAVEDKAQFVVAVAQSAQDRGLKAGALIKDIAAVCGGGGGGRPDMAQAGGKDNSPEKIQAALDLARQLVRRQLQ
ncbi:MAG: alanine--tRNA ligase [Bacillota bacterium]|nr:alanine--tRNA ligase [Bacillota bacterium]